MKRVLVLAALLSAIALAVWLVTDARSDRPVSDTGRALPDGREEAIEQPPTLLGLPPDARGELESDRAFPDLPPQDVPDGAGVIEPGEQDVLGRAVGPDGTSLVGGIVTALDPETGETLAGVSANREGRFWLRLPKAFKTVRVRVTPPKGSPALVPRVFEAVTTGDHDLLLEVRRGVWVEGEVVDEDGDPLEAFVRQVTGDDHLGDRWVKSGEDGVFRIAVAPGACRLYADAEFQGLSASSVVEVRAPARGIRLVCPPSCAVRGRVIGARLARFQVEWRALGHRGRAGDVDVADDGSFAIPGLPRGRVLLVTHAPNDVRCATATLDVRESTEVELVLERGLEITGWVRSSWVDLKLCTVSAQDVDHGMWWWCRVEAGGGFRLQGLVPGRYRLTVISEAGQGVEQKPVTVGAGTEGLEIVLD